MLLEMAPMKANGLVESVGFTKLWMLECTSAVFVWHQNIISKAAWVIEIAFIVKKKKD